MCTTFFVLVALVSLTSLIFSGIGLRNASLIERRAHKTDETQHQQQLAASYACLDASLCDDITTTAANNASTIGLVYNSTSGTWTRKDLCRSRSDFRFFGASIQVMFLQSGDSYTLQSDTYLSTLTISENATLFTNGYRLFVRNKLVLNGTIDNSGRYATNYTDHSLGSYSLPELSYSLLTFPTSTNAPGEAYEFLGGSYSVSVGSSNIPFTPCPLPDFTQVLYTDPLLGGAYHLSSDPTAAIKMRDLSGTLYTGGSHGCPAYTIHRASNTLMSYADPGGAAGGIIVIAAHTIEFGPHALIDASGSAPNITGNYYLTNTTDLIGLACTAPDDYMYQFPGGSGGGGIISLVTATQIDQATIDRVCNVGRARNQWIPSFRVYCNSTGNVTQVEPLNYRSFNNDNGDGRVFVHDVCNTWPGRRDLDADDVYECTNETAAAGVRCDCKDTTPLSGDTWNDRSNCGLCDSICAQDCVRGRCVPHVASITVNPIVSSVNTSATILNNGPDVLFNVRLDISVSAINASVALLVTFDAASAKPSVINQTAWLSTSLMYNCTSSFSLVTSTRNATGTSFLITLAQRNTSYSCAASTNIHIRNGTSVHLPWLFTASAPVVVPIQISPLSTAGTAGVKINGNYDGGDMAATNTLSTYDWFTYVINTLAA
jgi:hypothetical protein